jgi:hypothetical protein
MSKAEIQATLQPQARKNALGLNVLVGIYIMVVAVTLILEGMNIYGLRANPPMLTAQVVLTLITLGFLGYGIHLVGEWAAMDRADESLAALLRRRLRFYRTKYEIWLWMVAITVLMLSFAVVTMRHNQDGRGQIDRGIDLIDVGVAIAQLLAVYAILKIGHYPLLRELKAILSDLEHQVTTGTERIKEFKRTWRRWAVLFAVLGTILLIWGILRAVGWPG